MTGGPLLLRAIIPLLSLGVVVTNLWIGTEYTRSSIPVAVRPGITVVHIDRQQVPLTQYHRGRRCLRDDVTYLERMLNSPYARYYYQPTNISNPLLNEHDSIYRISWMSPFVLEEHRLLFFTVPKVACTVFKQLFRRMSGYPNWKKHNNDLPHKQQFNGLKLLRDYPLDVANDMLTNDTWTRAFFVRDPRERLLSAYLDKGIKTNLINKWCCKDTQDCGARSAASFEGFLSIVPTCLNNHWEAQAHRMEEKFWFTINFVGHMETAAVDTHRLLSIIANDRNDCDDDSLWNKYGANGWGGNGTEHIFQHTSTIRHGTGSSDKVTQYYNTTGIGSKAKDILRIDYEHPLFNFSFA